MKALRSLRVRLALMFFLIICVAFSALAVFASQFTTGEFHRYVEDKFRRDVDTIGKILSSYRENQDPAAVQASVENFAQLTGQRIILTDENRKVLADSKREAIGQVFPTLNGQIPIQATPEQPLPDKIIEPLPVFGENTLVVSTVEMNLPPPEILPLRMQFREPENIFVTAVNRSLWVAMALAGVLALLAALVFSARILKPVQALTVAAHKMGDGDLSQRVKAVTKDEIGELARTFNRMADNLERSENLRRQMVSDVAHELRTPLTNIRGYLEAIQDGVADPSPEIIASLYEEAALLTRLVADLQELTLAEAGQLRLHPTQLAPAELLEKAVTGLQPQALARRHEVKIEVAPDLPLVNADPERAGQILRNLLTNAIKYTPPEGKITVAARSQGDFVAISVQDTGVGIAPEHLPNLFERFYRADSSRTRATGGTGLGLAIARQLTQAQGGEITVESKPGVGSIFTFTLPVALVPSEAVHVLVAS
jgi:signal transduction histidine kinase